MLIRREVFFFDKAGEHNTDYVIEAVKERVKQGDIGHIAVASISGKTALRIAQELRDVKISIVCVSGPPSWSIFEEYDYPMVKGEIREKLEELNVK